AWLVPVCAYALLAVAVVLLCPKMAEGLSWLGCLPHKYHWMYVVGGAMGGVCLLGIAVLPPSLDTLDIDTETIQAVVRLLSVLGYCVADALVFASVVLSLKVTY
ncbi:hypothetical protein KIPB_016685, partial [Kipferlia bialata]